MLRFLGDPCHEIWTNFAILCGPILTRKTSGGHDTSLAVDFAGHADGLWGCRVWTAQDGILWGYSLCENGSRGSDSEGNHIGLIVWEDDDSESIKRLVEMVWVEWTIDDWYDFVLDRYYGAPNLEAQWKRYDFAQVKVSRKKDYTIFEGRLESFRNDVSTKATGTTWKFNSSPLKPKGKDRLPSIIFELGELFKFVGCYTVFWLIGSLVDPSGICIYVG